MVKKIILCADDFGYAEHISHAILSLAHNRRISAISCITNTKDWIDNGPLLEPLQNQIDIGLHFNLTEGLYNINSLLIKSALRLVNHEIIERELNRQLDSFIDIMKQEPNFIDGHMHVHTFPVIRDILIKVIRARFKDKRPYVRAITPMLYTSNSKVKSFVLHLIANGFSTVLDRNGINHNPCFGGIYNLKSKLVKYRDVINKCFKASVHGTIIMCHPGERIFNSHSQDIINDARVEEYLYLSSNDLLKDLLDSGLQLSRFNE